MLRPTIDGEVTNYFEWVGAGELDIVESSGSMHQVAPTPKRMVTAIRFGFDADALFVRVDLARRAADLLADKGELRLTFFSPPGHRVSFRREGREHRLTVQERRPGDGWEPERASHQPGSRRPYCRAGGVLCGPGRQAGPDAESVHRPLPGRPGARAIPATSSTGRHRPGGRLRCQELVRLAVRDRRPTDHRLANRRRESPARFPPAPCSFGRGFLFLAGHQTPIFLSGFPARVGLPTERGTRKPSTGRFHWPSPLSLITSVMSTKPSDRSLRLGASANLRRPLRTTRLWSSRQVPYYAADLSAESSLVAAQSDESRVTVDGLLVACCDVMGWQALSELNASHGTTTPIGSL